MGLVCVGVVSAIVSIMFLCGVCCFYCFGRLAHFLCGVFFVGVLGRSVDALV